MIRDKTPRQQDDTKGIPIRNHRRIAVVGLLCIAAIVIRVAAFTTSIRHLNVSGDEGISALQAIGITQSSDQIEFQAKQHPPGLGGRFPLLFMTQPYLFPLDSYIQAPLIRHLPRNAFGVRLIPALLGLGGALIMMGLAFRCLSFRRAWLTAILIAIPSSYVLLIQSGTSPCYATVLFFSALSLYLAQRHAQAGKHRAFPAMGAGLAAGLACTSSFLAIPVLLTVGNMVGFDSSWRRAFRSALAVSLGALIGLLPLLVTSQVYPGAMASVTETVPLQVALSRLLSPTLGFTIPHVLSARCTIVPDAMTTVGPLSGALITLIGALWLTIVVVVTLKCAWNFVGRIRRNHWPSFCITDVLTGVSWASLLLFVHSVRFGSHEFRYLLLLAWAFPFLIGSLYSGSSPVRRYGIAAMIMLFGVLNMAGGSLLLRHWARDDFDGYFTDTEPAIEHLQSNGISRCYASYFDTYALNYISDERILCSQPFNERFYMWPLPYKDIVDSANKVAYVLGPSQRFQWEDFEQDLAHLNVEAKTTQRGKFRIYTDFVRKRAKQEAELPPERWTVKASHSASLASALNDGDRESRWRTHHAQTKGMWVDAQMNTVQAVHGVKVYYGSYLHDHADALTIKAWQRGAFETIRQGVEWEMDPFEFANGHPIYGVHLLTIRFEAVETDRIRLEIDTPNPGRDWTLGELAILVPDPGKP